MQKVFNLMALTSFIVSVTTVAGGVYLYNNRESLIETVKENIVKGILPQSLPTDVNSVSPGNTELPTIPNSPF